MSIPTALHVGAALIIRNDQVLIAQRPNMNPGEPSWEFPGGKVEPGESLVDCLIRELKEEMNLTLQVHRYLLSSVHFSLHRILFLHGYWCSTEDDPLTLQAHLAYRWVSPQEIELSQLLPLDRPFALVLRQNGRFSL